MIKFFRSIRQKLLTENKFSKYFIYAIGEIVLVVIGILIALSINNWSEGKKEIAKEQEVLESIFADIKQTEVYLNNRLKTFKNDSLWMDYLSRRWNHVNIDSVARIFSKNKFDASFHNLFLDFREFNPPMTALMMITNDESFSLIKNKNIKEKINLLVNVELKVLNNNIKIEMDLLLRFKEKLMADKDSNIIKTLDSTPDELSKRFYGSDEYFEKTKFELETITKKNYARNYLNLKARHRMFISFFLAEFKAILIELKDSVSNELYL